MQANTSTNAMPLPKINVPPAHLLHATQEYIETTITAISAQSLPSQQTISAGVSFAPYSPETRDIKFTLAVITLIITINIGLAWMLGSGSSHAIGKNATVGEEGIHLRPAASAPSQDVSPSASRKKILSDILDSSSQVKSQ